MAWFNFFKNSKEAKRRGYIADKTLATAMNNSRLNKAALAKSETILALAVEQNNRNMERIDAYRNITDRLQKDLDAANATIRSLKNKLGSSEEWWTASRVEKVYRDQVRKSGIKALGKHLTALSIQMNMTIRDVPVQHQNFSSVNAYHVSVIDRFLSDVDPNLNGKGPLAQFQAAN